MIQLERKIGQLRARLRAYYAGHGAGRLLAFVGTFALGSFACDYLFGLPLGMRALLLAGFCTGTIAVAWRDLVRPLGTPMSDDDMVLFYESAHPEAGQRLISALQLRRQVDAPDYPFSRQLTRTMIDEADSFSANLDASRLVGTPELKKRAAIGGGLGAAILILAVATPELFSIWLQRFFLYETEWPRKTNLAVEFYDSHTGGWTPWKPSEPKSVVRGESARLRVVDTRRSSPPHILITYETKGNLKSQFTVESNPAAPDEFEFTFPQVIDPIVFRPQGGDHKETPRYTLEVRIPPRLNEVRVGYRLPRYTRTPASEEARRYETGNVETIPGTVVLFFGQTNVPIREAWLVTPGGRVDLRIDGETALAGEFRVLTPGEYSVRMISTTGLENRDESRFTIRIKPDRPPAVSIVRPARDLKVLADSKIPVAIEIEDDFGIDAATMRAQVVRKAGATDPEVSAPVPLGEFGAAIPKQAAAIHLFELAPLKLAEGDEVTYWAQASDLNDVAERPGSGESNRFKFTVVSRATLEEEIYELGKEILTDLERLREHQLRTRDDTVELGERVRADGLFTDPHTKRLFQLALWQQHVRTSSDEISKRLRKMIDDIEMFQLAQRSLVEHLKAVDELARGIADSKSPAAHQAMVQAPAQGRGPHEPLDRAAGRQKEIVEDLTRAIELMNEFSTISRVIRGVQGVIKTQKEIQAEALEKHKAERKGKER